MTKTIENPTIYLSKESEKLIKKSFKKESKIKTKQNKPKNKNLTWLNEI